MRIRTYTIADTKEARMNDSRTPIQTPVYQRLLRPTNPTQEAIAWNIASTIRLMDIRCVDFLRSTSINAPVVVRLQYAHGEEPESDWAERLLVQIVPERGTGWIGRIREYLPSTRELFLVPRPGRLDESVASHNRASVKNIHIAFIGLGVFLMGGHYLRSFPLRH